MVGISKPTAAFSQAFYRVKKNVSEHCQTAQAYSSWADSGTALNLRPASAFLMYIYIYMSKRHCSRDCVVILPAMCCCAAINDHEISTASVQRSSFARAAIHGPWHLFPEFGLQTITSLTFTHIHSHDMHYSDCNKCLLHMNIEIYVYIHTHIPGSFPDVEMRWQAQRFISLSMCLLFAFYHLER